MKNPDLNTFLIYIFLLLFIFSFLSEIASNYDKNVFIISYNENCKDNRNIIEAIAESAVFPKHYLEELKITLHRFSYNTKLQRLGIEAEAAEDNNFNCSISNDLRYRELSQMSMEERRDELIGVLNFFVLRKAFETSGASNSIEFLQESKLRGPSSQFLKSVEMDIVDASSVSNDELFKLAETLPCLESKPERNGILKGSKLPNDIHEDQVWVYNDDGIRAEKAWDCETGEEGKPIVVGVLDTGCSGHKELHGNLCTCDEECYGGDFLELSNPNPFRELANHGTFIAGVIAAVGNNGYGMTGLCWGCKIMCLKIGNEHVMELEAMALAIDYVVTKKKNIVRVINASFGGFNYSNIYEKLFRKLHDAGMLAVVAAGNMRLHLDQLRRDENKINTPCSLDLDNIICVGGSAKNNGTYYGSNYGKIEVDIFAPGDTIYSLCNKRIESCEFKISQGTSYAAPVVAGVAAAIWSKNPSLTYRDIKKIIIETARKHPTYTDLCVAGGVVDFGAAMKRVTGGRCKGKKFKPLPPPERDYTEDYASDDFCTRIANLGKVKRKRIGGKDEDTTKKTPSEDKTKESKPDKETTKKMKKSKKKGKKENK